MNMSYSIYLKMCFLLTLGTFHGHVCLPEGMAGDFSFPFRCCSNLGCSFGLDALLRTIQVVSGGFDAGPTEILSLLLTVWSQIKDFPRNWECWRCFCMFSGSVGGDPNMFLGEHWGTPF